MAQYPVKDGAKRITSKFGGKRNHRGVDFGWYINNKAYPLDVYATEAGTVYVGKESGTGYFVVLVGKTGRWLYAHLKKNSFTVKNGQKVKAGQHLALMGNTGSVFRFGVHLHLGLSRSKDKQGRRIYTDPLPYLKSSASKPKPKPKTPKGQYDVLRGLPGYATAADAVSGKRRVNTVKKGRYYVYNRTDKARNVTKKKGVPGSWIKHSSNKK